MLGPNRVKANSIKSCIFCFYVRCTILIVRKGGMPQPQTQSRLPVKDRAIKGLIFCYVQYSFVMGHWTSAKCVCLVPYCGQDDSQVPQHPIDIYRYNIIMKCIQTTFHIKTLKTESTRKILQIFLTLVGRQIYIHNFIQQNSIIHPLC